MGTTESPVPACTLKCLRNVEDVSHSIHPLKYGVNTIGRGLNNDIVIKNLNVSRIHCHLRVEKNQFKDVAYIKDLGTSNGTIVGNINLIEHTEHHLNDLDMIVLASGDEGVVLQFLYTDCTISDSNLSIMHNKRKVLCEDHLNESITVKIPKLAFNESNILKSYPTKNSNFSNVSNNDLQISDFNQPSSSGFNSNTVSLQIKTEPNTLNYKTYQNENRSSLNISNSLSKNLQQFDNEPASSRVISNSTTDSVSSRLPVKESNIGLIDSTEPSCSHYKNNTNSVQIKTEPNTLNNVFSQGTYREEEDSVIIIYSSDEENNIVNQKDLENLNVKIDPLINRLNFNTSTNNPCPSTSKIESNQSNLEWSNHCQEHEERDNEDDIIYVPSSPELSDDDNINALVNLNDSDSDYNSKFPEIIEPLPIIQKKKKKQQKY